MLKLRSRVLLGVLLAGAAGLATQPAAACSRVAPEAYEIDPDRVHQDSSAPTPFRAVTASTRRITGLHCKNGACISSSCGDTGYVELRFEPPRDGADDPYETTDLGYRVVWLNGKMPEAMRGEIGVVRPLNAGGSLQLEVGYAGITELDGELALVAVDRAGNESAPSEPVRVVWSGCTEYFDDPVCAATSSSHCSVASPSASSSRAGLWLWVSGLALGLISAARRRERMTRPRPRA